MAGGVLGAAGFLQPCQGEQQALSGIGCRMGRRTRVLPRALLPASVQKDTGRVGGERSEATEGQEKAASSRQWALLLPRDEEEEAAVQERLRKNSGLCWGVAKGPWGGT